MATTSDSLPGSPFHAWTRSNRLSPKALILGADAVVALLAGVGLLGAMMELPELFGIRSLFLPMPPNAAICLLLLVSSMAALSAEERSRALLVRAAALLVASIATARLAEYALGLDLAVDRWLIHSRAKELGFGPIGKTSLSTALVLEVLSLALILLSFSSRRLASRMATAFGVGASFTGFTSALAFFFIPPGKLAFSGIVPTALPTSVCFVLLGLTVAWHGTLDEMMEQRRLKAQVQRERDLFERV